VKRPIRPGLCTFPTFFVVGFVEGQYVTFAHLGSNYNLERAQWAAKAGFGNRKKSTPIVGVPDYR
jgi:hypothetical protein